MAVTAGARSHEIAVDDDVLVGVDRAVSLRVADQVVVYGDAPSLYQLRRRRDEPHAMADDALDDRRFGERALEKFRRRRHLLRVLGVPQPIRYDTRRHDDR